MNDLADLKWDGSPPPIGQSNQPPNVPNYSSMPVNFPNISRHSTPNSAAHSGRSSPLSGPNAPSRSTPLDGNSTSKLAGLDSFSNLLPSKKSTQLSMQERQKQLIDERARQAAEQQKRHNEQFRVNDAQFWEDLGKSSGRSTPAINEQSRTGSQAISVKDDGEDILAAFNASAPVDSSSHFPPPANSTSPLGERLPQPSSRVEQTLYTASTLNDDDDPFGLGQMSETRNGGHVSNTLPHKSLSAIDDDDILGALGMPVSETAPVRDPSPLPSNQTRTPEIKDSGIRDRAIAELVDMGFSAERSHEALDHTSNGLDIQAAVSWLLNQAHQESKSKMHQNDARADTARSGQAQDVLPEDKESRIQRRSQASQSNDRFGGNAETDVSERTSETGSSFFKSANSFWQSGQKRMQKALADFQAKGDVNQPRWMTPNGSSSDDMGGQPTSQQVTDEALMMDLQRPGSQPKQLSRSRPEARDKDVNTTSQPHRPTALANGQPQKLPSRPVPRPAQKLSRQVIEEQSKNAYVSPSRRRKTPAEPPIQPSASKPETTAPSDLEPELDIFNSTPTSQSQGASNNQVSVKTAPKTASSPAVPRPKAPTRQIPSVSPSSLSQANNHRHEGTAAFKRGDYSSAHASYTAAIALLPPSHPIIVILHSNRALTSLKNGDPKAAISDADTALNFIGPSRGEGEAIPLGDGEVDKPMKEFYGKSLMRKAEALEHMEKWTDATKAWREAVGAGVGGAISIQGRNRCEKASGITPSTSTSGPGRSTRAPNSSGAIKNSPVKKAKPPAAVADLGGSGIKESDAVSRLRAANAAAVAASDEAFALSDSVEARLNAWKAGKEGNLRGLLASLDTVLWEGASWTKVGMGDLVMPNRCKVVYMKAIAKTHPDKIPPDASIEQRMISASVFATLNEAWDRFKIDNGL